MSGLSVLLITVFVFVVAVTIVGLCLPRFTKMQRSIEIKGTVEEIFPYLESLQWFVEHWSPWSDKDPDIVQTFNEIDKGPGASYDWKGNKKVGAGTMEITSVEDHVSVTSRLHFQGRGEAEVTTELVKVTELRTKVIWHFHSDNKYSPVARIFGIMMDYFLGPDFQKGLENLKGKVENNP